MGQGAVIAPGDSLGLVQDGNVVPCRVLTGWHEGLQGILFVVRRLTDGQRLLMKTTGELVEVEG